MKFNPYCLASLLLLCPVAQAAANKTALPNKPRMEVVFVVDTTGSMGGLIEGAKRKIWSIVNEIVTAKPRPEIKVGFVAYRDKGDEYVTQVHDLTADLDAAYGTLAAFKADGGGDEPEHVQAGLHDGVAKIHWSQGGSGQRELYQVIFLVGDCPPHFDYQDGLDYKRDCKVAGEHGIFVNTIRCGSDAETQRVWMDIAKRGMGSYFSLAEDGGTVAIPTPYDDDMIKLGRDVERSTISSATMAPAKSASGMAYDRALAAPGGRENALARSAFNAKSPQIYGSFDIVTQVANGTRRAEDFKESELPEELRKMSPAQRGKYLDQKVAERKKAQNRLIELEKQRSAFLRQAMAKKGAAAKDGFDQKMLHTFKQQAGERGFLY